MADYIPFMKSYFDSAQKIKDEHSRLKLYEVIFDFAFNEIEPEFNDEETIIDAVFTAIKPVIENKKKVQQKNINNGNCHKSGLSGGLSGGLTQNNSGLSGGLDIDKDKDKEKDIDIYKDKDKESSTTSLPETTTATTDFLTAHDITAYSLEDIENVLNQNGFGTDYLEYVWEVIKTKYPDKTKKQYSALFNKAYKWQNLILGYNKPEKEQEKTETIPPPKKCKVCGKSLQRLCEDTYICPHCREEGRMISYSLVNKHWEEEIAN